MQFNSIEFVLFFPVVCFLFFSLPARARVPLLVLASYVFYMAWNPYYVFLILASTLVDYFAALEMGRYDDRLRRRRWLWFSLAANLGLLFTFKYANFFGDAMRETVGLFSIEANIPHLDVLLPVGISFYTFQTLSYTIEVYRANQSPERNFLRFALYVSFFPQLVAGPIERPQRLLPQLHGEHPFDYDRVVSGLRLMLWGMFKKVVIADRLAVIVDGIYSDPARYPGMFLTMATVFFAFQIYCDFSGYTDIARGAARVIGVDLTKNFNRPYTAASIRDFWRRWHITLSTWFRDYVYIPLGGQTGTVNRWYLNLFVVFVVSGLWHGANWTFIVWGGLHGGYYVAGHLLAPARRRVAERIAFPRTLSACLQVVGTFVLVVYAWTFFRADSVAQAWYFSTHYFQGWFDLGAYGGFSRIVGSLDVSVRYVGFTALLIPALLVAEWAIDGWKDANVRNAPAGIRWAAYAALAMAIMNLGVTDELPFVYFQF